MADWITIFFKAFCCGCAATGFGVLFNTPGRVLPFIWIGGFLTGLMKFSSLAYGHGIVESTFAAATVVGLLGVPIALWKHIPPVIFTIPSIIPLVPGAFAYKTMLGLMKLSGKIGDDYNMILAETTRNGMLTLFMVMAIAIGVVVPMIILEKYIAQHYFFKKK